MGYADGSDKDDMCSVSEGGLEERQKAPTQLYRYYDSNGTLLYVGISFSALVRAEQHKRAASWWHLAVRMTVETYCSRAEALAAETAAIRSEKPRFNIAKTGGAAASRSAKTPKPLQKEEILAQKLREAIAAASKRRMQLERELAETNADIERILKDADTASTWQVTHLERTRQQTKEMREAADAAQRAWLDAKDWHRQVQIMMEHALWQQTSRAPAIVKTGGASRRADQQCAATRSAKPQHRTWLHSIVQRFSRAAYATT